MLQTTRVRQDSQMVKLRLTTGVWCVNIWSNSIKENRSIFEMSQKVREILNWSGNTKLAIFVFTSKQWQAIMCQIILNETSKIRQITCRWEIALAPIEIEVIAAEKRKCLTNKHWWMAVRDCFVSLTVQNSCLWLFKMTSRSLSQNCLKRSKIQLFGHYGLI